MLEYRIRNAEGNAIKKPVIFLIHGAYKTLCGRYDKITPLFCTAQSDYLVPMELPLIDM